MRLISPLVFIFICSILTGCSQESSPETSQIGASLINDNNLDQDQKNYSIKRLPGGQEFPTDCDWENLERVIDGDTIVVEDDLRVRLIGIDTPESKHPKKKIEPHALEATKALKDLIKDGETVCLITSTVGDVYDYYGRKLAYIFSEASVDINAEMIRTGYAKGYFKFPFDRKEEFQVIESEARESKRVLWGD